MNFGLMGFYFFVMSRGIAERNKILYTFLLNKFRRSNLVEFLGNNHVPKNFRKCPISRQILQIFSSFVDQPRVKSSCDHLSYFEKLFTDSFSSRLCTIFRLNNNSFDFSNKLLNNSRRRNFLKKLIEIELSYFFVNECTTISQQLTIVRSRRALDKCWLKVRNFPWGRNESFMLFCSGHAYYFDENRFPSSFRRKFKHTKHLGGAPSVARVQ